MARLFNLTTKQPEEFTPKEAYSRLNLEQDKYAPIKDEKYFMENKDGRMQEVLGQNVFSSMGDGYRLQDEDTYAIRKQLRAENSQVGQFAKSMVGEALTFGLYDDIVNAPKNPLEEEIKRNRDEIFGTARQAGEITGMIAPFALGGIGGIARLAGKGVIKQAVRTGLKGVGKAPSGLLVSGALKAAKGAGEKAAKIVAKLGGGKKTQALAKLGVGSATVVGLDAGVEGFKETARQTRQAQIESKEKNQAHYKMSKILGQGWNAASESFTSGALFMAGAGVVGGTALGVGKAGLWAARKVGEKLPDKLRKSFFNDKDVKKTITKFRETFGAKGDSDEAVYQKAAQTIQQELGGQIPSTRKEFLKRVQFRKENIGVDIGNKRKAIKEIHKSYATILDKPGSKKAKKVVNAEIHSTLNSAFNSIKKMPSALEKGANVKGFNRFVTKLQNQVNERFKMGNLDFDDIHNIAKVLSDKAKFQTTVKPTAINKFYRQAYGKISNAENKYIDSIIKKKSFRDMAKKMGPKFINQLKGLKENKRSFEVLSAVEEPMKDLVRKPMSPFSNFFLAREGMLALGIGGFAMGRPGLAATALGAGAAAEIGRRTGYKFLQTANNIEKSANFFRKSKTVQGVSSLIDQPAGKTVLNSSALGLFFLGKPVKNMEEFDRNLQTLNPIDQFTTGQEDLIESVGEFGGVRNINALNNKLVGIKKFILQTKPKPQVNPITGKKHYDSLEEKVFLKKVSAVTSPEGFVDSVRKGEMTHQDYKTFAGFYPEFSSNFLVSLTQGVQEGKIKNKNVDQFLRICKNQDNKELIYYQLDKMNQGSAMQTQPPKRKVNIKTYSEPSISERARSGIL